MASAPDQLGLGFTTHEPPPEPLWRDVLGARLRESRLRRGQTLAQTAARAGISTQYLSEVERGRKEPSSEIIAAIAGALDSTLAELTGAVSLDLTTNPHDRGASPRPMLRPVPVTGPSARWSGPVALAA